MKNPRELATLSDRKKIVKLGTLWDERKGKTS